MRRIRPSVLAFMSILAAGSLLYAADPTYPIKLYRPAAPGQSYDVHITINQSTKQAMTIPGAPAQSDEKIIKGDITGRLAVAAVDPKGDPATFTITVTKFLAGPDAKEAVAAGKVISIKRTESDVIATLPDGEQINPDALDALKAIYQPVKKGDLTDDDIFGSKTPRAVNESWPVDSEKAAKDLSKNDITINAKDLTGQTTLKGVEKANGGDALHVVATMEAKNVKPNGLPPDVALDDANVKIQFEGLFPTDPNQPPAQSNAIMDMTVHTTLGGGAVKMDISMHAEQKETVTLVAK